MIYNNFISDIKAPNSSQVNGVVGIHSSTTTANSNIGIYYNTIYLLLQAVQHSVHQAYPLQEMLQLQQQILI
ncbi:MAG: hypothetical protein IPM38_10535 [Ignavibacteria bacterium]|nr:hypothetical protein [Ignavibacteria bacterium]